MDDEEQASTGKAKTLGDLRAGLCVHANTRDAACSDSMELWEWLGLPEDTSVADLRELWTVPKACELARRGRVLGIDAVAWVEQGLGTAIFRGVSFQGVENLRDMNLQGVCLGNAIFHSACDLQGTRFDNADLSYAGFNGANLRGVTFRRVHAPYVRMQSADLTNAQFTDASLRWAGFVGANLQGAAMRGADLRDAAFIRADLRGTEFHGAILAGANFAGALADEALPGWKLVEGRLQREQ